MRAIKNLIGAVLISIAVLLVWVIILPDYEGRAYLQSTIQLRSANLDVKNKLISKVEELDKEYQSRYAELKRLSLVVPEVQHLEEMITIWEDMFSSAGIPLKDMTLSAQEDKAGSPYNPVNMEFNLSSTNDSIINLLSLIERSIRLIDIVELAISVDKDAILTGDSVALETIIKARSYFLSKNFKVKSNVQQLQASEE